MADPIETCQRIVGQTITGIEIDHEEEKVTITLGNGFMEFEGDGLELYVELKDLDS